MTQIDFIDSFLQEAGIESYQREKMTPDASYRRYERIMSPEGSFILMIVPVDKPMEDGQNGISGVLKPFIEICGYLDAEGLRVPKILYKDVEKGLLLTEDLG